MLGPTGGPTTCICSRRPCTPAYVGRFSWVLFYSRPPIKRLQRLKHVYLLGPNGAALAISRHSRSACLVARLTRSLGVTARAHSSLAVPVHDPSRSSRFSGRSMDSRPALLARVPPYVLAFSLAPSARHPCVSGFVGKGEDQPPMPRRYAPTRPPARRPRASPAGVFHKLPRSGKGLQS